MTIFVGLDCGGSSCRALANDSEGQVLFQGQSGAVNLATTPTERLRANLRKATADCPPPAYLCGCFAGLLTSNDRIRAAELLRDLFPTTVHVRAEPDYLAALYASERPVDICVVAGTGSLVCSAHSTGVVKSGGRGYLLGDEGSAFRYGQDGMLAFLADPSGSSEILGDLVERYFESCQEPEIVAKLYRSSSPASLLAKLAKGVAADALAGREYALDSLKRNSRALARIVIRHAQKKVGPLEKLQISLSGGLWSASNEFVSALERALVNESPPWTVELHVVKRPPVQGAVALAREMSIEH